jgi:hypothetical protein
VNNWPALIALSLLLVLAMALVAWAAFTLGDPPVPKPRRPLPFARHARHPRNAPPAGSDKPESHMASGYVTTRKLRVGRYLP